MLTVTVVRNLPIGGSWPEMTSVGVLEVDPAAIGHFCVPPFVKSMVTVDRPLTSRVAGAHA